MVSSIRDSCYKGFGTAGRRGVEPSPSLRLFETLTIEIQGAPAGASGAQTARTSAPVSAARTASASSRPFTCHLVERASFQFLHEPTCPLGRRIHAGRPAGHGLAYR